MTSDQTVVDMSSAAIEERLEVVSRLSPLTFAPLPRVNMTSDAIESRLRECAEMSAVCRELEAELSPPPGAGRQRAGE